MTDLISALYEGAGLVLTVEDVLPGAASVPLSNYLSNQATWSDLLILVLAKGGGDPSGLRVPTSVFHMTSLIDDLLDIARVTRGLITLDEEILDVRHILAAAIEQVNPQFNARYQEFSVHMPDREVSVLGDSKRLIQVIANLLNNASKYTVTNGKIAAHLSLSGDDIVLKVTDNGIGIEPKMVSQVFDLFAQAERTSDCSQGGLGLGLALVKSLILSHGGSVEAESKGSGQGSTFTIQIPHLKSETLFLDQLDPSSTLQAHFSLYAS